MDTNKTKNIKFDKYKNYVSQLENQYLATFSKIEIYINGSTKLNATEKNNCFLEILDTFLSGQAEGKSVEAITGKNLKNYCDNMIYGETIYIYKASRVFTIIIGVLFYICFMQFFTRLFVTLIDQRDGNIIFQPMIFGLGDIALILGYICIPKLISLITRNYFENPVRCKKVKRYTYYGVWLLTIIIYTSLKDAFSGYGIVISFSNSVLILIFITLVDIAVYYFTISLDEIKFGYKQLEKQQKYYEFLNKRYEKYKIKAEKNNKTILSFEKFSRKGSLGVSLLTIAFFIYAIIFLAFIILICRGLLIEGFKLDGAIILLLCYFIEIILVEIIKEGLRRTKQLSQPFPTQNEYEA